MEKIIVSDGCYKEFLKLNLKDTEYTNFENKDEKEIETNFHDIFKGGLKNNLFQSQLNLSFIPITENLITCFESVSADTNINEIMIAPSDGINQKEYNLLFAAIKKISNLISLYVYNTKIEGIELTDPISDVVKSTALKSLLISDCKVGNIGFPNLIEKGLAFSSSLRELILSKVELEYEGFDTIGLYLAKNTLELLSISSCNSLGKTLERSPKFDFNSYHDKEADFIKSEKCCFLRGLLQNTSLRKLLLVECELKKEAVNIIEAISKNKNSNIDFIDFSKNEIDAYHFVEILSFIKTTKSIEHLTLNSNRIGDLGFFFLQDYLKDTKEKEDQGKDQVKKDPPKLKILDLEDNNITDKGIGILITSINDGDFYLTRLGLAYNLITKPLIVAVANALVILSKANEEKAGQNFDMLFTFINIGQISIDLIRNRDMTDSEYNECYLKIIEKEYNRYYFNE